MEAATQAQADLDHWFKFYKSRMAGRHVVEVFREFPSAAEVCLGFAVEAADGWKFYPHVVGRRGSNKFHDTLEACLPRWVGYPDQCSTRYRAKRAA